MYFLKHFYQVLAILLPIVCILIVQLPSTTNGQPLRTTRDTNGRLSVSVVRSALTEFLKKNNNPEKSIEEVETRTVRRTSLSVTQPRDPTWIFKYGSKNLKKMRRRSRRKRQKRGAKVNKDATYISDLPTHRRVYKFCNKLGFFLRLNPDGTVDGTTNANDPNTIIWLESHGRSIIRVKGHNTNRYLTMNQRGVPSAELNPGLKNSLFRLTEEENAWDTIASWRYYIEEKFDMMVGITRDATVKQPWKASPGQYATQFLPLHISLDELTRVIQRQKNIPSRKKN